MGVRRRLERACAQQGRSSVAVVVLSATAVRRELVSWWGGAGISQTEVRRAMTLKARPGYAVEKDGIGSQVAW